jgi:hypothetical protein
LRGRQLDSRRRLDWIAEYPSAHTRQTGHAADAPPFAEPALAIARGLDDLQFAVAANYYLGTAYHVAGEHRGVDEGIVDKRAVLGPKGLLLKGAGR